MAEDRKSFYMILCLLKILAVSSLVFALGGMASSLAESTQVIIAPDIVESEIGESFTLTVNITNIKNFYAWQIVLKYNGSIINCTAVWIPDNNVFAGHMTINIEPVFDKDYKDGLNFLIYACSLFTGSVNVQNGILFKANFTIIGEGVTKIALATDNQPAFRDQMTSFRSLVIDDSGKKIAFSYNYSVIKVRGISVNLKPIARFFAYFPVIIDEEKYIVIRGPKPVESIPYLHAYRLIVMAYYFAKKI